MPLSTIGKNKAAEGATKEMKYIGVFETEKAAKALTKATKSSETTFECETISAESLVVFTEVNGKTGKGEGEFGVYIGRPYFCKSPSGEKFELATEVGGSTVLTPTGEIKTTSKILVLKEVAESPYARQSVTWKAASQGTVQNETGSEPACKLKSVTITWAGWWSVSKYSSETKKNESLYALEVLAAEETFSSVEGEYKFTSDKLEPAAFS